MRSRSLQTAGSKGLVQDGFEQAAALGLREGELRFQLVAQRHQVIHFGDDPALFGDWREANSDCLEVPKQEVLHCSALGSLR